MSERESKKGVSRRDFIKGAVLGAGTTALTGLGLKEAKAAPLPEKWDKEADVLVVGYGGAGAAAAITVHDSGAKVLILEKMPKGQEGGNTRVSGGGFQAPRPEDLESWSQYMNGCDRWNQVPDEVTRAAAEEYVLNESWWKFLGGKPVPGRFPNEIPVAGVESQRTLFEKGIVAQEALWKVLSRNIEERKIEILFDTPGKRLIQNPSTREIVGVIAGNEGKEITVKAKRAVVLTTGGFENNEQMQKDYSPVYPIYYFGTPGNTGDGVRMAAAVGADLWHMNNVMGACSGAIKVPEYKTPFFTTLLSAFGEHKPQYSYALVDKFGKRFINESRSKAHGWAWREIYYYDLEELTYPMIPWYVVFDEKRRRTGPICATKWTWAALMEGYKWSKDNSAEIEKGWILKADTIKELGEKILGREGNEGKMKPALLDETIAEFNQHSSKGEDPDFGRPGNKMAPLDTPPFYAAEVWPGSVNTQGGPRRDARGQILDVFGDPIPRLYSAGELGSIWASLYQGGGNVGECYAFGRITGRNAAAEKPWKS